MLKLALKGKRVSVFGFLNVEFSESAVKSEQGVYNTACTTDSRSQSQLSMVACHMTCTRSCLIEGETKLVSTIMQHYVGHKFLMPFVVVDHDG